MLVHLSLAAKNNSRTHYAKGTLSHHEGAPTACRHAISGSISLPSPGFFSPFPHGTGSLSVIEEYLALADGPAGFTPGFTCPVLLGIRAQNDWFRLRVFHSLWTGLPAHSTTVRFLNARPTTPALLRRLVWAVPISLAATFGITVLFSFPSGTKMVQFPEFARKRLCIHLSVLLTEWVAPFRHPRIKASLAAPRGFSQPVTSFVASRYLGILRMPLLRLMIPTGKHPCVYFPAHSAMSDETRVLP